MGYGRYRENSLPQATLRPSGYGPDCVGAVIRERQLVVIKRQSPLRTGFPKVDVDKSNAFEISTSSFGRAV
jgi:hypothetical protein